MREWAIFVHKGFRERSLESARIARSFESEKRSNRPLRLAVCRAKIYIRQELPDCYARDDFLAESCDSLYAALGVAGGDPIRKKVESTIAMTLRNDSNCLRHVRNSLQSDAG
jgi:hypothetical protein